MLSATELGIILLSLKISMVAMLATTPLAFGCAWLLARSRCPGRILLEALIHLPLILPPVVTGWLLLMSMGPDGPVGRLLQGAFGITLMFRWTGAALAAAIMAFPLMVRAMRIAIESVDVRLESVARTLGARPARVFATVTLPLCLPGIAAGIVLGFARSLGEFGATITFVSNIEGETRTLPLAIYSALQSPGGEAIVWRLSLLSILLSLVALVTSELILRRSGLRRGGHVL